MTDTAPQPLTPAEHLALAEADLARTRAMTAGTPAYAALVQSAIAHALINIARSIDPDDVPAAEVRLPGRLVVRARQSPDGERKWDYVITAPGQPEVTSGRFLWDYERTAIAAGVQAASRDGKGQQA